MTVIATSFVGWWIGRNMGSPAPLVVCSLGGVAIALWRLLAASR
jgi:hypothetical protein